MTEDRPSESTPGRLTSAGSDELEASRAAQAGADFDWHFGRVTSLGTIEIANSRTVTILWEEGGISSQQREITDEQWEIFKLAFVSTGRIAILSDQPAKDWMYDYRFLEARPLVGRHVRVAVSWTPHGEPKSVRTSGGLPRGLAFRLRHLLDRDTG